MIQSLQQSVQSVIDEGRIGSPVFLRCIVHAPIEAPDAVGDIAALTAIANNWMPDPPEQIYALDNADRNTDYRYGEVCRRTVCAAKCESPPGGWGSNYRFKVGWKQRDHLSRNTHGSVSPHE